MNNLECIDGNLQGKYVASNHDYFLSCVYDPIKVVAMTKDIPENIPMKTLEYRISFDENERRVWSCNKTKW